MSFVKKTWKDRVSQYLNRRQLTDVNTGSTQVVTVVRDEGNVSETGDPFTAANMNDLEDRIDAAFAAIYPVGSIYISVNNTNPGTYFTGTTWEAFAKGRTLVGVDPDDVDFNTVEATGGEKTHTLTIDEMPSHNHSFKYNNSASGGGSNGTIGTANNYGTTNTGGNQPHNNLQPYVTCYMWKRTA